MGIGRLAFGTAVGVFGAATLYGAGQYLAPVERVLPAPVPEEFQYKPLKPSEIACDFRNGQLYRATFQDSDGQYIVFPSSVTPSAIDSAVLVDEGLNWTSKSGSLHSFRGPKNMVLKFPDHKVAELQDLLEVIVATCETTVKQSFSLNSAV